jgi:hypothetical protein
VAFARSRERARDQNLGPFIREYPEGMPFVGRGGDR